MLPSGDGVLGRDILRSSVKKVPVRDGFCLFDRIKIPVNPMIGVIGVAPAGSRFPAGRPALTAAIWIIPKLQKEAYALSQSSMTALILAAEMCTPVWATERSWSAAWRSARR